MTFATSSHKSIAIMFVHWILLNVFAFSSTLTSTSDLCQSINICRNITDSCYPVVLQCHNGTCDSRQFSKDDPQRLIVSNWFYHSKQHYCRRNDNGTKEFVTFQFLHDCTRLCLTDASGTTQQIRTTHPPQSGNNLDGTAYVQLNIDLSPAWMQRLLGGIHKNDKNQTPIQNAHATYNSQMDYFQNYRRRFSNFLNRPYQLMLNYWHKNNTKNP